MGRRWDGGVGCLSSTCVPAMESLEFWFEAARVFVAYLPFCPPAWRGRDVAIQLFTCGTPTSYTFSFSAALPLFSPLLSLLYLSVSLSLSLSLGRRSQHGGRLYVCGGRCRVARDVAM